MSNRKRIVCFGPGPRFKGGISNFNTSLALALHEQGQHVHVVSWSQQYPFFIPRDFKDSVSKTAPLAEAAVPVHYLLDYNNPFSWWKTVRFIKNLKPDIVIIQWAITIQAFPLSFLAKRLKKAGIEVIFDVHNVVQKENSGLDAWLTKTGLRHASKYITHSELTIEELNALIPNHGISTLALYHPNYDLFTPKLDLDIEAEKRALGLNKHVFLFFGFIRKYKGLHHAIRAFHQLAQQRDDISLLICGESFWNTVDQTKWTTKLKKLIFGSLKKLFLASKSDEKDYRPLEIIQELGLEKEVVLVNTFIPNEAVHRYFQVSDAVVLFYEYATPSGIESLAYNFNKPILATAVDHFKTAIKDGVNGYLAEAENVEDMARVMAQFIEAPVSEANVRAYASRFTWENYARSILGVDLTPIH
ncbi:MAG: glycosyltransferase [Saprospiraceae bacterium]|nr:glycosyltransferase [Saprospiraceae bacterium]